MRTWLIGQVVLFTMLGIAGRTPARTIVFDDFSDLSSLTLNGTAAKTTTTDGAVLRLARALGNQSGSAFSTQTINGATFSTYFRFRISNPGGVPWDDNPDPGADGLVFVSQPVSASLGGAGHAIGYGGISPSVGVEFDTWHNSWNHDPDSNHLGIDLNGIVDHDLVGPPPPVSVLPRFDDANIWHAWVDYDGTTLEVRANQSGTRPASPLLTRDIDIPSLLGATEVYVGFTAGTGNNWGDHDIVYWEYRDEFNPIPEPSTLVLLAVGAVCLTVSARRRCESIR